MWRICLGMMLGATEITPAAPTASMGTVSESSPERTVKPLGMVAQSSEQESRLPVASFMATMVGQAFTRRATVALDMVMPQRPGMLYSTMGISTCDAMA